MKKLKNPDLSKSIITIKGYHSSAASAFGAFGIVFFSIVTLIIAVEGSKVFSAQAMVISWAVCGAVTAVSVAAFVGGIVMSVVIKKRDCVAFFNDFLIVYEFNNLASSGYLSLGYDEIAEYGFVHELDRQAQKLRMYLPCEVFNYGKLIISDTLGKKHTVPVKDIDKAKENLQVGTGKEETIYQRLHGIHY